MALCVFPVELTNPSVTMLKQGWPGATNLLRLVGGQKSEKASQKRKHLN